MKFQNDAFTLKSGKKIYANCGIIGIAKSTEGIYIHEGYDGTLDHPNDDNFTLKEKQEIAEYVIGLWKEWAQLNTPDDSGFTYHPNLEI